MHILNYLRSEYDKTELSKARGNDDEVGTFVTWAKDFLTKNPPSLCSFFGEGITIYLSDGTVVGFNDNPAAIDGSMQPSNSVPITKENSRSNIAYSGAVEVH